MPTSRRARLGDTRAIHSPTSAAVAAAEVVVLAVKPQGLFGQPPAQAATTVLPEQREAEEIDGIEAHGRLAVGGRVPGLCRGDGTNGTDRTNAGTGTCPPTWQTFPVEILRRTVRP